ncbi:hypothetical protein AVEN_271706-1 [Araneus ventricosus]|uniref:Uncharacterized protein n=1 Tax=Araneus ventricosus TaxID=182803 RepID=A0A4Y2J3H4_ARAVE|nr:hypothetical protein AVEN_271706-1 [Araneus ventricosus]
MKFGPFKARHKTRPQLTNYLGDSTSTPPTHITNDNKSKEDKGNQSIGQPSVHKDSFGNPPTNRRIEEVVVVDWPKMINFKDS